MPLNTKETNNVPTLEISGISDIHYDDPEHFNESIHKAAYKNALQITQEIIKDTRFNDKISSDKPNRGISTSLRNKEQICNIIFFTGDKGTGKTSTMLSYMEFLKDYYRNTKKGDSNNADEFLLKLDSNERSYFMFTGIEHIDASSLNNKEDILGDVLSKMLSKWKNEEQRSQHSNNGIVRGSDYDYKRRQMRLQFSEIYERLKELRGEEEIMKRDNDMFIEAIESLSFSWNVKKSFQRLVEAYLDIMVYPESEGRIGTDNHYLVISIDDLDMNVQSGFLLLEQIRKYLMVPGVLVLMSANYEQLEKICYNYYWREFKEIEKNDENKQYMWKLSREYLEKMVPSQRQVELKSNRQWEYFLNNKLKIEYPAANESLKTVLNMEGTLCDIVSKCMYRCFGVRYGLDNRCISYLAPGTLREIFNWTYQINNLTGCYDKNKAVDLKEYEENQRWFFAKEFSGVCNKYLNTEFYKVMQVMEVLEPSEQVKKMCSVFNKKMGRKEREPWLETIREAQKYDKQMRDFAYLCIIFFNMKLSDAAVQLQSDKVKLKARDLLLQYYSAVEWGVWGSWEDRMIVMRKKHDGLNIQWVNIARHHLKTKDEYLTLEIGSGIKQNGDKDKNVKSYFETHKESIQLYQYLLLFYNLEIVSEEGIFQFDERTGVFSLAERVSGYFSLSGFVLNIIEGASLLRQFQKMVSEIFDSYKIDNKEKEKLCKNLFIIPNDKELLLPIDNIDFLIHMGTRIQKELGYPVQGDAEQQKDVILQIKSYFRIIIECLNEYDSAYNSDMANRFSAFGPVRKVLESNVEFTMHLYKRIMEQSEPYDKFPESEWVGGE